MPSKRKIERKRRKASKRKSMARDHKKKGSGNSNYARKERFLHHNGGFGFDWPSKPWKS